MSGGWLAAPKSEPNSLNMAAKLGEQVFNGKAQCAQSMFSGSIPSRDGTRTPPQMCASTAFGRISRNTC
jgi:hypothetical protein